MKRAALPGFFRTWAKVAWADLLASLPDEDDATVASTAPTAESFRQLVREAMLTQIVIGQSVRATTEDRDAARLMQTERRSLVDWCYKFAKPGPWRSIRSYCCWSKTRVRDDGEVILMVAIRHELFSQIKADRRLTQLTANSFSRRASRYAIGSTDRTERPHGLSAVVLADDFVQSLVSMVPEDGPEKADSERLSESEIWSSQFPPDVTGGGGQISDIPF